MNLSGVRGWMKSRKPDESHPIFFSILTSWQIHIDKASLHTATLAAGFEKLFLMFLRSPRTGSRTGYIFTIHQFRTSHCHSAPTGAGCPIVVECAGLSSCDIDRLMFPGFQMTSPSAHCTRALRPSFFSTRITDTRNLLIKVGIGEDHEDGVLSANMLAAAGREPR